jgi:hypothetical protein
MNQCALPFTKQQVLEGREAQKVVFGEHNKP